MCLEAGWSRHSPGTSCPEEDPDCSQQSWALAVATVPLSHVELMPLGWAVCAWDAQLCYCRGAVCAVLWVAHLDVTFGWAEDALASLAVGTAPYWDIPFIFPAETGGENTSHGKAAPGRKMLKGSQGLS